MATQTTRPAVRQQQPAEPDQAGAIEALEKLAQTYGLAALDEISNRFERALKLAQGLQALRNAVKPIMPQIMALQGSKLGYKTDRDKTGGYGEDEVRDAFIEATLRGFAPTGNEWNIISGSFYGTKEGWEARVKAIAGLTDLKVHRGVPAAMPNGALVPISATWKLDGKPMRMDCQKHGEADERIPVRLDRPGVDAAIGKAERKLYYRIYQRLTGTTFTDQDMEDSLPPQPQALGAKPENGSAPAGRPATPTQKEEIATLRGRLGVGGPEVVSYQEAEAVLGALRDSCRQEGLFPEDEAPPIQLSERR